MPFILRLRDEFQSVDSLTCDNHSGSMGRDAQATNCNDDTLELRNMTLKI